MPDPSSLPLQRNGISPFLYHDFVNYFKYASSAYLAVCPRPNDSQLVLPFNDPATDIQGYVARHDGKKEIVVVFRGSASIADMLLDTQIIQIPLLTIGVNPPEGTMVHSGFLTAWNSVALIVLACLREQIELYPDYALISTGHSLGGALCTLAAISMRFNFDQSPVRCYSYGAPRVGNRIFANLVNELLGEMSFRIVHTDDGVPTMIPREPLLGYNYHHSGIEYWHHCEPPKSQNVKRCNACGEDDECSSSIPSHGINEAHMLYFGIIAGTPFCL